MSPLFLTTINTRVRLQMEERAMFELEQYYIHKVVPSKEKRRIITVNRVGSRKASALLNQHYQP